MEADSEVKGKGKWGVGGFQRMRRRGDYGKDWLSLRRNAAGPWEILQQATLLPKPRALRSYSGCPGTISLHLFADLGTLASPYLRAPGGEEKRASPFPPLPKDNRGGEGVTAAHTRTHSRFNSLPRAWPPDSRPRALGHLPLPS